ncbi:MAG TPA: LysM peptidoglycan-binding domain-containing protein [Candidatus Limnocylindria bacterium]|nr:LysM peptidoglycan-binding domain-containing protein [Candidatus Limnocylindria bacterium]
MAGSSTPPDRRTFTPAIVGSAIFVVACAVFAIAFVGARGGLQLPVASRGLVAEASVEPTEPVEASSPTAEATILPTLEPTAVPSPAIAPTAVPTVAPTLARTPTPTSSPGFVAPTLAPGDPLLALPGCPGHPGCREYVIQRGDTLSGIISRYLLDIDVLQALNADLDNPNVIVVGRTLYLGRDPFARLDPCPDGAACYLYVVAPGDSIAEIAARFELTSDAILAVNPALSRPIVAGQVLKLPAV